MWDVVGYVIDTYVHQRLRVQFLQLFKRETIQSAIAVGVGKGSYEILSQRANLPTFGVIECDLVPDLCFVYICRVVFDFDLGEIFNAG